MRGISTTALLLSAMATASAQEPTPQPEHGRATASVSVGYVMVPFVVKDDKGRVIKDLEQKGVTLLADGKPVATDLFARNDRAPVSFAILLDGSGSMALLGKLDGARTAIQELLSRRVPGDDFALYVFSEGALREEVAFTDDAARVKAAVAAVKPFGTTALYDAIAKMPELSKLGKNGSRAVILLTDGIDNRSTLKQSELLSILEGIELPVYPLGFRSNVLVEPAPGQTAEALLNMDVLGHIARMSGGRMEVVTEPEQLDPAIREIESDLRTQYLVGFFPTGRGPARFHPLALKLPGSPQVIRVRSGYRGTDPPIRGRSPDKGEKKGRVR